MFQRLSHYGLQTNLDRCIYSSANIIFLVYHVDTNGIIPLLEMIKSTQDFPKLTSTKHLHRFTGMVNFYQRFMPNCSTILLPQRNLQTKMNQGIMLEGNALYAFHTAKTALADFTKLSFIGNDPRTRRFLTTDASDAEVGVVVQQELNSQRKLIMFFSVNLLQARVKYSCFFFPWNNERFI